ncbi:jacalin-like lectin [Rhodoferax koreense]|uniref:jacalin-like lectin n=1 Tax=Rhodoferax koreensis TaxID=1842727 RepID=UPI001EF46064|nr:jacalin-like lectin [Rhodoferax koreense]
MSSLNTFDASPYRNAAGELTAAAANGKTLFIDRNCVSCHAGTTFAGTMLQNIGTIKPSSGSRLGGALTGIDIPTLRDVWRASSYLHDGSAATLDVAVQAHGASIPGAALTAGELADLSAYLQQIGSEEPMALGKLMASPLFGSANGTVFADMLPAGFVLTGVNLRSGWWLDAIQGVGSPSNLAFHGGNGGTLRAITWPADEYLVRVYGKSGTRGAVAQLGFVTNTGRNFGPYGTGQGQGTLTSFDYTVPAGRKVYGFVGRSSDGLNAVGVLHGPL